MLIHPTFIRVIRIPTIYFTLDSSIIKPCNSWNIGIETMPEQILTSDPIPEQVLNAGQAANINLAQYFHAAADEVLTFSINDFPPGIEIDAMSGILTGKAINVPFNTPFLVSVTATSQSSNKTATEHFALTIVPVGQPQEAIVTKMLEDKNFLANVEPWQLQQWIQYIIQEHYACIYIFNGAYPPVDFTGGAIIKMAKTGFAIYNYENHIIIAMGDMAFREGNRGRMIRTLEEIYSDVIPEKNWPSIGLIATDDLTLAKAWVLAKLKNLPVSEIAPNDDALFNYRNLAKLQGISVDIETKLYARN